MSRLSAELHRLFSVCDPLSAEGLRAEDGQVRALVLGVRAPADGSEIGSVWRGVQAELGWPGPAIALSGDDALQLWFALARPVPVDEGAALVQALARRFLPQVRAQRLQCWPEAGEPVPQPWPGREVRPQQWSAFIAPDLAPVFGDTPWLDIPPGEEAQVGLLAGVGLVGPAEWTAAQRELGLETASATASATAGVGDGKATDRTDDSDVAPTSVEAPAGEAGAREAALRFLRGVMDDAAAPLALRLEAAKTLLEAMDRQQSRAGPR